MGNEIALGDVFFIGSMLRINPMTYYQTKLPYVIFMTAVVFLAYGVVGFMLAH
jgi:VIT1/CCC1 family predicted Fe2+/Mn2+ transporter